MIYDGLNRPSVDWGTVSLRNKDEVNEELQRVEGRMSTELLHPIVHVSSRSLGWQPSQLRTR